ncbi:gag_pre-integrs domain-containing protein/UBN2_3 domain-containing protein, partial [Cephalotus follicularis]
LHLEDSRPVGRVRRRHIRR